jgi:Zn-dependent protease with chaperone function
MWEKQYLQINEANKEVVSEDAKTTIGLTVLIPLAMNLITVFVSIMIYKKMTRHDIGLSKKIKDILKDGKDWKVMIVKDKGPNAFCIVRPYIFISIGLMKMMTEREIIAICLHEAGHLKNYDMWKKVFGQQSFLWLVIGILMSATGGFMFEIFLLLLLLKQGGNIIFARTLGRAAEKRADSYAVKYGYADEIASSLKKLDVWFRKMVKKHCKDDPECYRQIKISQWMDEHPPLKERIENILKSKEVWEAAAKQSFSNLKQIVLKKLGVNKEDLSKGK